MQLICSYAPLYLLMSMQDARFKQVSLILSSAFGLSEHQHQNQTRFQMQCQGEIISANKQASRSLSPPLLTSSSTVVLTNPSTASKPGQAEAETPSTTSASTSSSSSSPQHSYTPSS